MQQLVRWSDQTDRMPLLIRGARQVGKTFLVEDFAKQYFTHLLMINFELNPEYKVCFNSLNPQDIINRLSLISQIPIEVGHTLLFLDEIQECPEALHIPLHPDH